MDELLDTLVAFVDNLAMPISLNKILSGHIIPVLSNVLVFYGLPQVFIFTSIKEMQNFLFL